MSEFLWFVAGAIVGFLGNILAAAIFPWVRLRYTRLAIRVSARRSAARQHVLTGSSAPQKELLTVGGLVTEGMVLSSAHYIPGRIRCHYDDREIPLPEDLARLKSQLIESVKSGTVAPIYNSPTYSLRSFDIGYRDIIDGEEVSVLQLDFTPTDYFTQCVTDLNVGNPVREKYARHVDVVIDPVPEFTNLVTINLNLITKDSYLIVMKRSEKVPVSPGTYHCSVGENLLRPADAGPDSAPDPFSCALRGAMEELGIALKHENVDFTHFVVAPRYCQYSLIGWAHLEETRAEIEDLYRIGVPKDKWENRHLMFISCKLDYLCEFLAKTWDQWSPNGLTSAVICLFQLGYSKKSVDIAIAEARRYS